MSEILVRMKVDVWRDGPPEISWVRVCRKTKHTVYCERLRLGDDNKIVREEKSFSRGRLERAEQDRRGAQTPGNSVIHWLQDDREPIQGGEKYKMALADVLEMINAEFRRAAVRINELEGQLADAWKQRRSQ